MTAVPPLPATLPSLVLGGLGVCAIALAWVGSAETLRVGDQADWAIVGVAGTAGVVLASLLWVVAARRAVEHRLGQVLARLEPNAAAREVAPGTTAPATLVATPAMAHYHRAACPLALGKPVSPAPRGVHEVAGRQPCGVCRP